MRVDRKTPRAADRNRLDQPQEQRLRWSRPTVFDPERFGRASEAFARWMGTAQFLIYMTVFVTVWLAWNTFMPESAQFDPRSLNYTLLTLIMSLQASYAAPLILLAQNRQDDRDRVGLEQDRARDERNLADTEFLTREVAALRIAMRDMATRDYLRSELRDLLEELEDRGMVPAAPAEEDADARSKKARKKKAAPAPAPETEA
ncbi:membrane protein [Arsenicicoccus sp. oral taxon 190]|nr:membrane protein [Arsenicicoccus sp. oral taxon 190]